MANKCIERLPISVIIINKICKWKLEVYYHNKSISMVIIKMIDNSKYLWLYSVTRTLTQQL